MARRCGSRIAGGVYIEVPLGPGGVPIEHFICDPAIRVPDGIDIPKRGMVMREGADGTHILYDWIGEDQYPNVLDFVEEVREQGLSRRISSTFEFGDLTPDVRYCAIHKRGYVHNEPDYREYVATHPFVLPDGSTRPRPWHCPKRLHTVDGEHEEPCSGVWWQDIRSSEVQPTEILGIVRMPTALGNSYLAHPTPEEITPMYMPGIIMIFPVVKLSVIRGKDGEHDKPYEQAQKARANGIRVELEDA